MCMRLFERAGIGHFFPRNCSSELNKKESASLDVIRAALSSGRRLASILNLGLQRNWTPARYSSLEFVRVSMLCLSCRATLHGDSEGLEQMCRVTFRPSSMGDDARNHQRQTHEAWRQTPTNLIWEIGAWPCLETSYGMPQGRLTACAIASCSTVGPGLRWDFKSLAADNRSRDRFWNNANGIIEPDKAASFPHGTEILRDSSSIVRATWFATGTGARANRFTQVCSLPQSNRCIARHLRWRPRLVARNKRRDHPCDVDVRGAKTGYFRRTTLF